MEWPHAPSHYIHETGTYIITCGTYRKEHFFRGTDRLTLLEETLLSLALQYGWQLQAWAVFSNHYHFIATSPPSSQTLPRFISHLHTLTATAINKLDSEPGRKVWFQYWDTLLTYQKSYLTRLNYVNNNPVKHGLVDVASHYKWCSASWFERTADRSFFRSVATLKTDKVTVRDDFLPIV
jgi:putative transposase